MASLRGGRLLAFQWKSQGLLGAFLLVLSSRQHLVALPGMWRWLWSSVVISTPSARPSLPVT